MYGSLYQYAIPRWGVMWVIALILFGLAKAFTWGDRPRISAPMWKHIAYLFAWPGMDADAFLNERCRSPVTKSEWCFAIGKTVFGVFLTIAAYRLLAGYGALVVGWTGMLGIVFALHFGLFHILSCFWRSLGVQAISLMNWPIAASSLIEFWNKRWNLAFRDLTHRLLFRPLARFLSPTSALILSFVASGVVHDLVISIPAEGGYGLPTLYFVLQGVAILFQRSRYGKVLHLNHGLTGRLFTIVILVMPCPLLFHNPFIFRVVVPFLEVLSV